MKSKLLIVSILISITFVFSANKTLSTGFMNVLPFQAMDKSGHYYGFDCEIISTVFGSLNYRVAYHRLPWKTQLQLIKLGRLDMISGAGYTKDRADFAYFSLPYRNESFSLYLRKSPETDSLSDTQIFQQFCAGKIKPAINRDYFYGTETDSILSHSFNRAELTTLDEEFQIFEMFRASRINAFIIETASAEKQLNTTERNRLLRSVSLPAGGTIHLMFNKNPHSKVIVDQFNSSFAKLLKSGKLAHIYTKYGITPPSEATIGR